MTNRGKEASAVEEFAFNSSEYTYHANTVKCLDQCSFIFLLVQQKKFFSDSVEDSDHQ